ncbi:MAG: TIGR01777 family oxidoreductase [bacterium]
MIIVVSGASGLIGTPMKAALRAAGHELRVLVRHEPTSSEEFEWDPAAGRLDGNVLVGAGAVINLSGAPVAGHRWNDSYKRTIVDSRVQPGRTLAEAIAARGDSAPPAYLVASAVGYYGDTGDAVVTEDTPSGRGFLADVCRRWEAAAAPAADSGHTRVVHLRTGLVLAPHGGALGPLRLTAKAGIAGRLGSGRQYQPWISLADEIAALLFLLSADVSGPVNLTGPEPVRQADLARELAHALHRPSVVPTPAFAVRLALGEFADEGVLIGQRAVPAVLSRAGYRFTHPTLSEALQAVA